MYPEIAWGSRVFATERTDVQFELAGNDDSDGFIYERGHLLMTAAAETALGLPAPPGPRTDFVDATSAALRALDLRRYTYRGARTDLPRLVAELQTTARADAPAAGVDPASCEVALNYALTGAWVAKGHPFDEPHRLPTGAPARLWPAGAPSAAVVDTGLDLETATAFDAQTDASAPTGPAGSVLVLDADADRDERRARLTGGAWTDELGAQAGHGTFITWVLGRQAANTARVVDVRALDADGICTEDELLTALWRLAKTYPQLDLINLSLGGFSDPTDYQDLDGASSANAPDSMPLGLRTWFDVVASATPGTVVVCAAGNNGQTSRQFWPAADHRAVAVAALSTDLSASAFTNRGDWVDVCTLGEKIVGDFPHGDVVDDNGTVTTFSGQAASWSGTSFAAPVVGGEILRRLHETRVAGDPTATAAGVWTTMLAALPDHPDGGLGRIWDPRPYGPAFDPTG